ncbi:MAG TPA: helix-turn-helix domain-containing protein [Candidatus Saccharimonadales bacterium]|nr:helix-turn-helix domain-containing protein [Candidatus Saccharimonadales bacterium]
MDVRDLRSDCPINYLLELVGDKWSLLIIRDMILNGKSSYGEFLASEEKIATNILANRLSALGDAGLISKRQNTDNKAKYVYTLTDKGVDLIPLFIEVILWSSKHSPLPIPDEDKPVLTQALQDKETLIANLRKQSSEISSPLTLVESESH